MSETSPRLHRLLEYLAQDPRNLRLLADAAQAALDDGGLAVAADLVGRAGEIAPLPPNLLNISGLVALREGRVADAADLFNQALAGDAENPALRTNLAWAKTGAYDWDAVCSLIDEDLATAIPQAGVLKAKALQHLGKPEEALIWGADLLRRTPDEPDLLSALSVAALDAEQPQLAESYAHRAGETPEALSTLGFLALNAGRVDAAEALFDQALAGKANLARALLGKGLSRMSRHDPAGAATWLDNAANLFKTHLGSWIAAGWAHFATGDLARSRDQFSHALAVDDTFAEAHGAIAVLDLLAGDKDQARRGVEVALRLDRHCFAGLLGKMLLLQSEGDVASAERLRLVALSLPIGSDGLTIAAAAARFQR